NIQVIPGFSFDYKADFKVRNAGATTATQINVLDGEGGGFPTDGRPMPSFYIPSQPRPTGPSLAAGSSFSQTLEGGDGPAKEVLEGNAGFHMYIAVSWKDVFGENHVTFDCRYFYRPKQIFLPCPVTHHQ